MRCIAGLDSTSAAQVVNILASLAHRGVNVLLSIHQPRPDVLRLMDSLLVLSPSGHLVYTGPTVSLDNHLSTLDILPPPGTLNVADYLLDYVICASPRRLAHMVSSYKKSAVSARRRQKINELVSETALESAAQSLTRLPPPTTRKPFGVQLWMLSAVLFRRMYRHPFLIGTAFVATLVAACSLAVAFWDTGYDTQVAYVISIVASCVLMMVPLLATSILVQHSLFCMHAVSWLLVCAVSEEEWHVQGIQNRFGMLFFMLLFLSLISLSSLPIWKEDMLLFFRERDSGAYSTSPYFLARVLFDVLPLRAVPPLLFTLITYPAAGLHSKSASCVAWFTITLVAGNTAASLLCMCLGALLPSLTLANMVCSCTLCVR